jgi:hypothetical protein
VAKTDNARFTRTAESIGTALGHLAGRVDSWSKQRGEIATELKRIVSVAQDMLGQLGHGPKPSKRRRKSKTEDSPIPPAVKAKLGRPRRKRTRPASPSVDGPNLTKPDDVRGTIRASGARRARRG